MGYLQPRDFHWPKTAGYRNLPDKPIAQQVFADILRRTYGRHLDRVDSDHWPGNGILAAATSIEHGFKVFWTELEWRPGQVRTPAAMHVFDGFGEANGDILKPLVRALNTTRGKPMELHEFDFDDPLCGALLRGEVTPGETMLFVDRDGNVQVDPADCLEQFVSWAIDNDQLGALKVILRVIEDYRHVHTFEASMRVLERFIIRGVRLQDTLEWMEYGARTGNEHAGASHYLRLLAAETDPKALESWMSSMNADPAAQSMVTRAFLQHSASELKASSPALGL